VLRRDPNHPAALHFLGLTRFKLGQRDDAIGMIRRAVAIDPGRVLAGLDLAVALRDTGECEAALKAYRQAIESVPAAETGAMERFEELQFDGSSAHTSFMQLLPVPSSAEAVPPLEDLEFSVDRGEYAFNFLDSRYRASVRYGGSRAPHALLFDLIDSQRSRYADFIDEIAPIAGDLAKIPLQAAYGESEPFWLNTWFPPLDAVALFATIHQRKPNLFIEIGSGMSTKFARKAISTCGIETRIVSIDPKPRSNVDALVDETVRAPLEDIDPGLFTQLQPNDVLFIDSSHRAFQNSDVTVFFLDILPTLAPGVVVHLHDVYLPYDYPTGYLRRLWNEQYLLATALLSGQGRFEVLFPGWFVSCDSELSARLREKLGAGPLAGLGLHGASFWFRV
jgi:tetratricopeptide (TPR) repeat protein